MASPLHHLDGAPEWLDSEPPAVAGRVVVVQFWTYSCINWLRTLPYIRAWHERYRAVVFAGVHAPEFGFEHDLANVRRAVRELGVTYPVVIDNDFRIWRGFDNHYWPALYLLDRDGRVAFRHFGEEAYEETERAVQALLGVDEPLVGVDASGLAEAADWDALRSPETYLGGARGGGPTAGALALNEWSLAGEWSVGEESAVLDSASGSIAFRFAARDVNLVLAGEARFTLTLDGEPPGDAHGLDVDASGAGTLDEPRMYQLVRRRGAVAERTVEIAFDRPGVRAYVFTFG